ncbi:MAG: ribose-phosphate pyrophosphokinase [Verrucomicrobiota bacterium]
MSSFKIFSGNSNKPLVNEICDAIGVPIGDITVEVFPDGESFVRINENVRGDDVFIVQSTSHPANHHLMELLIMIDAAKRASAARITTVIPFYGYARQDRKDKPRVPITSKLVANLITSAGADRVLTVDLHAQQIQGFFDIPVDHLYASPIIFDHLKAFRDPNLVLFSPDVGGMKMTAAYAQMLGAPMGFVAKRRMDAMTVEAVNVIGDCEDKDVLLIDDMTETAGTLVAAAKILKEKGARSVRAAVTHGVLNDTARERLSAEDCPLDHLMTTNTTLPRSTDPEIITRISIAPLLGEAINRIHVNKSVTGLFQVQGF